MGNIYLKALFFVALAARSNGQNTGQCYVRIEFPSPDDSVGPAQAIRGAASIPASTELRLFRKRHGAQTWMPMPGKIVCQGSPCTWSKQVDYGLSDTRKVDIAVVAVDRRQSSGDEGTVKLPLARQGCEAEVTVTVKK